MSHVARNWRGLDHRAAQIWSGHHGRIQRGLIQASPASARQTLAGQTWDVPGAAAPMRRDQTSACPRSVGENSGRRVWLAPGPGGMNRSAAYQAVPVPLPQFANGTASSPGTSRGARVAHGAAPSSAERSRVRRRIAFSMRALPLKYGLRLNPSSNPDARLDLLPGVPADRPSSRPGARWAGLQFCPVQTSPEPRRAMAEQGHEQGRDLALDGSLFWADVLAWKVSPYPTASWVDSHPGGLRLRMHPLQALADADGWGADEASAIVRQVRCGAAHPWPWGSEAFPQRPCAMRSTRPESARASCLAPHREPAARSQRDESFQRSGRPLQTSCAVRDCAPRSGPLHTRGCRPGELGESVPAPCVHVPRRACPAQSPHHRARCSARPQ